MPHNLTGLVRSVVVDQREDRLLKTHPQVLTDGIPEHREHGVEEVLDAAFVLAIGRKSGATDAEVLSRFVEKGALGADAAAPGSGCRSSSMRVSSRFRQLTCNIDPKAWRWHGDSATGGPERTRGQVRP